MSRKPMSEREIDALVAEKVMGWERAAGGWTNNETRQWSVDASHIPRYSEKIAAAWTVVEKMREGFFSFSVRIRYEDGDTVAQFAYMDGKYGEAGFHNAPMAICLAALKAVGVEVP